MDSSISHDPFAPEAAVDFPADRWRRVGATETEIVAMTRQFAVQAPAAREGFVEYVRSSSDGMLSTALEELRAEPDFQAALALEEELAAKAAAENANGEGEAAADLEGAAGDAGKTGDGATGQDGGQTSGEAASPSIDEQAEQEAAHGPWEPAETPLDVDGQSYPLWNLQHGYVGTLLGDEVDGFHLVRPDATALAEAVREQLAAQKPAG